MSIDPHIFRAYDIRGVADEQITEEACFLIGKGFGSTLRELYDTEHPTVAVGRDARAHGPKLEAEVIRGLMASGCHVKTIGQTPSPVNYFTVCNSKLDGSIQVTASHNPAKDNGLKLQVRDAEAYSGDSLQKLRVRIDENDFAEGEGSAEELDAITPYLKHLKQMFGSIGEGVNVAVDSGNGVAGPVYTEALRQIGCKVDGLYIEPDGTFPNHPADPSKYETLKDLQAHIKETGADVGLAFDGDGDRLGLVDETGTIRTADEVLLLLAQDHLQRHSGKAVIFTVSNSSALETEIEKWGGKPVMTTVGHSFVEHAMRDNNALLGGEQSGHYFCGEDYFGFDDALVAAIRIVKILKAGNSTLSELCAGFPKVYQTPEIRPDCPDDKKAAIVKAITAHFSTDYPVNTLDGVRIDFGDGAWAGIRKSNTSPKLSICMEARSPEKLNIVEDTIMGHLRSYDDISL